MKAELYTAVLSALRIQREDVFGASDLQLPVSQPRDAMIPQIGFVGQDYRPGGTLLLGINPGGGGDTYARTSEDSLLLPMSKELRDGLASPDKVSVFFGQYAANMRTWNLWRIAAPVLDACGSRQSQIAYLNWCPFRTRGDAMPHAQAMRRSRETYLAPLIDQLAPSRIIALGKKVGGWLEKVPFNDATQYVIPRTIGDSRVGPEALEVLEIIIRRSLR